MQGERAEAIAKAHSTPAMAGAFARDVGAQRLLLTHFSPTFALRESYCSVHALGEDRVTRLLRAAASGPGASGPRDARWLEEQAAALGAAPGVAAPDWGERAAGFSPQPRLLAAGVLETRRYAGDGGAQPRAGAPTPVTTTVEANIRELLRWRNTQAPLGVRRLSAFSHPDVRDHAAAAAVAADAQRTFGAEHVLCARDFMAVIVPSLGRDEGRSSAGAAGAADHKSKSSSSAEA